MKKRVLVALAILLGVLALIALGGYAYLRSYAPDYTDHVDLPDLSAPVEIYYDEYAIPHIYAQNDNDAYTTLGYLHARDRLWQIDIMRRIAPGRLSELFGESTVESDRFFKTIGLGHQSKQEAEAFMNRDNDLLKQKVLSYIKGVNEYVRKNGSSLEHKLIGVEMEPYTLEDIYNVLGYMSFSFSHAHKTDAIADYIYHKLGKEYLDVLDWDINEQTETMQSDINPDLRDLSLHINTLIDHLPAPKLIGSNSWVVGPKKSKDGNVIFANDPHIGYSQPCVWYESQIVTPSMDLYGYYLAGNPMAQIGHTRHHAIGLTMFENDDIDYYRLKINNQDQYLYNDVWQPIKIRQESINIKGKDSPETFDVRTSHFGPIISDVVEHIDSTEAVSMWWVYQKHPLRGLEATHDIMLATDVDDVAKSVQLIHAPGLNIMYGDVDGNIAWWAAAKLPKRPEHVNPKIILDGTTNRDEILGYYDFSENPQAINPESGYVYSANNQAEGPNGLRPPGYYLPEDRAERIVQLLESKDDWTTADHKEMITDVTSNKAREIVTTLLPSLTSSSEQGKEAIAQLRNWDGTFAVDEAAPTIYVKLIHTITKQMMADEMDGRWELFKTSHLYRRSVPFLMKNDTTAWWDNISTKDVIEDQNTIINAALTQSLEELTEQLGPDVKTWQWGKVHRLTHKHVFDGNKSLRKYFNVGDFAVPGTNEVINNYLFRVTDDGQYVVRAGPSTRRIINMGRLDSDSWSILPTGQSGNVQSPHYSDQAEMYATGKFRKQLMNKDEIVKAHKYHQTFVPK